MWTFCRIVYKTFVKKKKSQNYSSFILFLLEFTRSISFFFSVIETFGETQSVCIQLIRPQFFLAYMKSGLRACSPEFICNFKTVFYFIIFGLKCNLNIWIQLIISLVCGISMSPQQRVVGGTVAEKGSWPWMVSCMLFT